MNKNQSKFENKLKMKQTKKISRNIQLNMNKQGVVGWLTMAVLFLILALVTGVLGFGLISGISYTIAKWLAIIFVILFVITIIAHTIKRA